MKNYTLKVGELFTDQKIKELQEYLKAKDEETEQLMVQLAGCSVVALGGTNKEQVVKAGDYGWSASYQDVLELRLRYDKLKK